MDGFDTSEIRAFAADLQRMPDYVRRQVRPVIEHGALKIKTQLRQEMHSSRHFAQVASAISYDIIDRAGSVEAVVGPTKGSPGSLANIAYFGTSRGGGTVPDPSGALQAEVPHIERELADLIARYLTR